MMDAQKNNVALAHSYHVGKWCSEFGRIPPSGLGGDNVTDRQTDGRTEGWMVSQSDGPTDGDVHNIPIAFLKKAMGIK